MAQHAPHPEHEVHEDKNYGDPTGGATAYVALIGTLIFVLVVIYLQALYYDAEERQRMEKIVNEPSHAFNALQEEQSEQLAGFHYHHDYGDGTGRVTIPVDVAIERLLGQWPQMPAEHLPPQPVTESPETAESSSTGDAVDTNNDGEGNE